MKRAVLASLLAALGTLSAEAQNLLANPEFDVDGSSWSYTTGSFTEMTDDADGCANSYALESFYGSGTAEYEVNLGQCVTVTPGAPIVGRARLATLFGNADCYVAIRFFSDNPCTSAVAGGGAPPLAGVGSPWVVLSSAEFTVPGNASGAKLEIWCGATFAGFYLLTDRAYLGSPAEVFRENHEIGETCRWTDTEPR